jgi:RNA recognition motif-containing protein
LKFILSAIRGAGRLPGLGLKRAILMAKRLYVGNLKYTVTSEQLEELFAPFGSVNSAEVLMDRETGRSRGFGFVEMSDDEQALEAIEALDGQDHDGRRLNVNEAKPRTQSARGGGGGPRRGGGSRDA